MQPISEGEFEVINFLLRNFRDRYTVRNIAKRLKLSPAGVHLIFKKLEKSNIVSSEKLGSGLFYSLNFNNKVVHHLASIVLLGYHQHPTPKISEEVSIALCTKNTILLINDLPLDITLSGYSIIQFTPEELVEKFRTKDDKLLRIFEQSMLITGELELVKLIQQATFR